jgi:hypothetical protein
LLQKQQNIENNMKKILKVRLKRDKINVEKIIKIRLMNVKKNIDQLSNYLQLPAITQNEQDKN